MRALTAAAAVMVASTLVGTPAGQVFRSAVDMASFGVTVIDRKGTLATDLGRDDFEIREDGRLQDVALFSRGDAVEADAPLHLGLLFDTSGSMEEDIGFSRSAAIKFLNTVDEA
jgi:Ca-activated chloride channel family protein